ncbi:hypothetical protein HOP50_01g08350 [Chloropicon primus]|uniref:Uncharacterized protein n=1 Tax=Chloropicon primus TaxID=1764295 RepID=A0A5B8MD02_9CHLO|nr:hypothetical protein A3770_01p08470 [Chloropicon primus]UPQ97540.1 hypothetical protein HOP50_01g08350 [Chloropicon primus]|eukprot:QDZ18329.1 hypothetical protein A3770_01p08470 [Chloropicon primus]
MDEKELRKTMLMKGELTPNDVALLKFRPKKNLNAPWKILSPETDCTPRESYSQYMLRYHEPEEDTNPVEYRSKRGDFSEYIDKAIQLKVNLKSTAH